MAHNDKESHTKPRNSSDEGNRMNRRRRNEDFSIADDTSLTTLALSSPHLAVVLYTEYVHVRQETKCFFNIAQLLGGGQPLHSIPPHQDFLQGVR
jgi:hypothetical protein